MTGHTQYSHNKVQFAESLGPSTHHVAREVASLSDHGDEIVLYGAITACLLVLAVTKILLIFWSLSSIASETAIERYPATTMVSQQFRFRWTRRVCSYSAFFSGRSGGGIHCFLAARCTTRACCPMISGSSTNSISPSFITSWVSRRQACN